MAAAHLEVPATIAGLHFTTTFPAVEGLYNFTTADADGTIKPLVFPSAQTASPQPFSFERADGCTTFKGVGGADAIFGIFASSPSATKVDGGYRLCGAFDQPLGLSALFISGGPSELPPISVVQAAGKWYVSPLGTVLASVSSSLHVLSDDATLFDSPLAPFFYGGLSRGLLASMAVGQSADSVPPACLVALTVANGQISGVAANPSPEAVLACTGLSFSSSSSSTSTTGEGVVVGSTPVPAQAPQTPEPLATAPPATSP